MSRIYSMGSSFSLYILSNLNFFTVTVIKIVFAVNVNVVLRKLHEILIRLLFLNIPHLNVTAAGPHGIRELR